MTLPHVVQQSLPSKEVMGHADEKLLPPGLALLGLGQDARLQSGACSMLQQYSSLNAALLCSDIGCHGPCLYWLFLFRSRICQRELTFPPTGEALSHQPKQKERQQTDILKEHRRVNLQIGDTLLPGY